MDDLHIVGVPNVNSAVHTHLAFFNMSRRKDIVAGEAEQERREREVLVLGHLHPSAINLRCELRACLQDNTQHCSPIFFEGAVLVPPKSGASM